MHAVMSEWERDQISARTKAALAAAKARGVVLGKAGPSNLCRNVEARQKAANEFAENLRGAITGFRAAGLSQRAMVIELNKLGAATPGNGQGWTLVQLQRVLGRLA